MAGRIDFQTDPSRYRHLVRFAFCKKDETLREAVRRLSALRAVREGLAPPASRRNPREAES